MGRLNRLWKIVTHPRELRLALSGLGTRLAGDADFGGLSAEETAALAAWVRRTAPAVVVEIGTLFGLTAAALTRESDAHLVAVDNFSWNPFGLTPDQHEAFARRILEGSRVELVRADAVEYLSTLRMTGRAEGAFVFLDGSHAYDDVRREIEICLEQGVATVAGHDFGNEAFGVSQAVRDMLGSPDEVCGTCWMKRVAT